MQPEPKFDGKPVLVTGATGLLGSHIAEKLRGLDAPVRVLCRRGSDRRLLERIEAEVFPGDVTDAASLEPACDGVGTVFHAAAKVDDWGAWAPYARVTVGGTHNMVEAAARAGVNRFVHISSSSVYGHVLGRDAVIDESTPLGTNLPRSCHYGRAKIEAEKIVRRACDDGRLATTILRPCWLYGPRDRASLPRLIEAIRRKRLKIIGDGENRMNVVHAANAADAAVLAAAGDRAVGEIYNVSYDGDLTQRQYFKLIAQGMGEAKITAKVPYRVAYAAALLLESVCRILRTKRPPYVTRHGVFLLGRRCFYECEKIKRELGWTPRISYEEGVPAAVRAVLKRNEESHGQT